MRYLIILFLLTIGCNLDAPQPEEDWRLAPKTYTCTKEQMDKVEHESEWCDNNTTYVQSFCYGSAIIRNCTKMTK